MNFGRTFGLDCNGNGKQDGSAVLVCKWGQYANEVNMQMRWDLRVHVGQGAFAFQFGDALCPLQRVRFEALGEEILQRWPKFTNIKCYSIKIYIELSIDYRIVNQIGQSSYDLYQIFDTIWKN